METFPSRFLCVVNIFLHPKCMFFGYCQLPGKHIKGQQTFFTDKYDKPIASLLTFELI